MQPLMTSFIRLLTAVAACSLLVLSGCQDKPEPIKPIVIVPGVVIGF